MRSSQGACGFALWWYFILALGAGATEAPSWQQGRRAAGECHDTLAWVLASDGVPVPTMMSTISTLWRYDAAALDGREFTVLRRPVILLDTSAAIFPISSGDPAVLFSVSGCVSGSASAGLFPRF